MAILLPVLFLASSAWGQVPKWKKWQAQADTLYSKKAYAKAIQYYSRAIEESKLSDKESQALLYKRAFCYYTTEHFDLAIKDLEKFAPFYPESPQPWVLKAFVYREMNDEANQLNCLAEALKRQPGNPELLKWRAMIYLQNDDYLNAARDARQAILLNDDSEAETYLGVSYYHLNQTDSAFISFNKAIELDATYLAAYLYAGSVALQSEAYSLGIEYLDLALRLDPHSNEALFYKGVALVESGKLNEGCRCLNRAFYGGFDDAGDYLKQFCFGVDD